MKVNCIKCKYHYITFNPATPYGCSFFKFTAKIHPSLVVFQSSGSKCVSFELKEHLQKKEEKKHNITKSGKIDYYA